MATTRRRQSLAVIDQLNTEAWRFSFLQAVRILEAAVNSQHERNRGFASQPIAGLAPPHKELLRFSNRTTLAFSPANVAAVSATPLDDDDIEKQWHMTLQFFGLTGSQGVMPHYFTEILLQRFRDNDKALAAFINIFEHRSISLFHQASRKYQLPLQFEHARITPQKESDHYTHAIASLAGLGTAGLADKLPVPAQALLGYSGLYARPIRSAAALKSMLQHYFDLDAQIEQFCGQWQDLPDDIIARIAGGEAGPGRNNQLGINALLGKSCWQVQSKFRITLAPMSYDSFMELAPGGKKLEALQGFIAFFAGIELDYEVCIQLHREDVQPARLTTEVGHEPLLGWNTPLGDTDTTLSLAPIDILVSKHTVPPDAGLPTAV